MKLFKINKIYIISLSFVVIAIITITILLLNHKPQELILEYKNITVNLNDQIYNTDSITKLENGQIISDKELVDTSKIGKKEVVLLVEDLHNNLKEISVFIEVVDNVKPIINCSKELITTEHNPINLLENVNVTDNSNESIIPTIEGDYNFDVANTYNLFYVAKDSSGNVTKETFNLIVNKDNSSEQPKETTQSTSNNQNSKDNSSKPDSNDEIHFTTSKGFEGVTKNGITYIDGYLIVNKTYSLPSSYGTKLTKETTDAFNEMQDAAILDGIKLWIQSGFRSYATQEKLFNSYVKKDGVAKAETYSARPGNSEHQSGLAFDVNIINDNFIGTPEAIWLEKNCYKYGFILRYPQGKTNETGYKYEPWHFRYVGKELAEKLYNNGSWLTMEDYFGITSEYN